MCVVMIDVEVRSRVVREIFKIVLGVVFVIGSY